MWLRQLWVLFVWPRRGQKSIFASKTPDHYCIKFMQYDHSSQAVVWAICKYRRGPVLVHVVGPALGAIFFAQKGPKDHFCQHILQIPPYQRAKKLCKLLSCSSSVLSKCHHNWQQTQGPHLPLSQLSSFPPYTGLNCCCNATLMLGLHQSLNFMHNG